jgi:putative DNA primase/helicase
MDHRSPTNGYADNRDVSSILEEWLLLVEEEPGVLARCTDIGLNVDLWGRPGVERTIKGKKVILVFRHQGDEHASEFKALEMVRANGAQQIRIWKPFSLGDDKYPTLKELSKQYNLGEMLWWDKPWEYEPPSIHKSERRGGWPCTDLGNAERMATRYGSAIRFCRPWKKWLVWNGQKWGHDDLGKVNVMAKATIRKILEEAASAYDQTERIELAKWAIKCESAQRVKALLELVWFEPRIPILPGVLDPDVWLFNCPNGTIDLRTGLLRRHDRSDLITRMSPVEYDPAAKCPLWESTIARIFSGDVDLIGFIQRLFGLTLTGDVSEQILPIFYGEGGNGKSTILNALIDIMGPDYAIAAPPGLLFNKSGEAHPTDKASLFGMRLVVDLESAEGAKLNEALVKQLTGSDRISARRMREDFWTFLPTHTLIIGTNNQPAIHETKNAIWRRLKLVPFTVEIPVEEQQADLPIRLREEFPGILAWCVRGCLDWQKNKLQTPSVVEDATKEYRSEEDVLGTFLLEECSTIPGLRVKASKLYVKYRKSMEGSGIVAMSQTSFGRSMRKRGYEKLTSNGTWYLGIALRQDEKETTSTPY